MKLERRILENIINGKYNDYEFENEHRWSIGKGTWHIFLKGGLIFIVKVFVVTFIDIFIAKLTSIAKKSKI